MPSSPLSTSGSVSGRVKAARLTPLANIFPNNIIAFSSALCLRHRSWSRPMFPSYLTGRDFRVTGEIGRWYGPKSRLVCVLSLRSGPTRWSDLPFGELALIFTLTPGPARAAPGFGGGMEEVRSACASGRGEWEEGPSAGANPTRLGWAGPAEKR